VDATNDEYIPGFDPECKAPQKAFIPWRVVEEVADGMTSTMIDETTAKKLIAERELAYKYNEGFVE
jgi:hypothetical protein